MPPNPSASLWTGKSWSGNPAGQAGGAGDRRRGTADTLIKADMERMVTMAEVVGSILI